MFCLLQQYLPFTVLKRNNIGAIVQREDLVATVLTVYGIETHQKNKPRTTTVATAVATVLTVYGIETKKQR